MEETKPSDDPIDIANFEENEILISESPFQIIFFDKEEDRFVLTEEAQKLFNIKTRIKIIGIIGEYRSGKSLIMNKILNELRGFALGHTTEGKTRGIWCWGKKIGEETLLVLDTEGLFDVKNDKTLDAKLFVLSLLLSSHLIYNITSKIKETDISNLKLVLELTNYIKTTKTKTNSGEDMKLHLPDLMFLIRDFSLQLPEGFSSHDYLIESLKTKPGSIMEILQENMLKQQIRSNFPTLSCFTLVTPVNDSEKQLRYIEEDPSVLRPEFCEQLKNLVQHLRENTSPKKIGPIELTGATYFNLMQNYVTAFNEGGIPTIPDALDAVRVVHSAQIKNDAIRIYDSVVDNIVEKFPVFENTIMDLHRIGLEQSRKYLISAMFGFDADEKDAIVQEFIRYFEVLDERSNIVGGKIHSFLVKNLQQSHTECNELWNTLIHPLTKKMKNEEFQNINDCLNAFKGVEADYFQKAVGPAVIPILTEKKEQFEREISNYASFLKINDLEKKQIKAQQKHEIELSKLLNERIESEKRLKETEEQIKQQRNKNIEMEEARRRENEILKAEADKRFFEHQKQIAEMKQFNDLNSEEIFRVNQEAIEKSRMEDEKRREEEMEKWKLREKKRDKEHRKQMEKMEKERDALQKKIESHSGQGFFSFLSDIALAIPGQSGRILSEAFKKLT